MPSFCSAYACSNRSGSGNSIKKNITFHSFPLDNEGLLKLWLYKIKRKSFQPNAYSKLCSEHFEEECFKYQAFTGRRFLNKGAVPTIFAFSATTSKINRTSEADSEKRSSTENLEPTITAVNSVEEVCELHSGESAFEKETSAYDPKTKKTFCYNLSNNAKFKKDGISSLCLNSPVYMPESENVNIRLENDELQSSVQQSLENVAGNQIQSADAVTFLVPLHIFKQMQLSASDNLHWDEKEVTALIALYQSEKFLYDKKHEHYYDLHERNKAYERIKNVLTKMNFICTIPQIKNFLNILFTKYSSEKAYKDKCIQAGQFTEDTYAPTMWCFGLLQFLDDYIEPGTEVEIKTEVMEEDQHEEDQYEEDQHEIQLLNSNVDHLDVKAEPKEVSNIEENVQLKIDSTFSINADFSENLKVNGSETEANLKNSVSNKLNSIKIFFQDSEEKEDIFGEYIASEMETLKGNPLLYMQTKQAILDVLTRANFNLLNHK